MSGAGGAFTRRGAIALAAIAAASLAATAFLGVYGDVLGEPPSFGPDSYSRSALGHRAYAELLRRLGREVIVSRYRTDAKAADGAVVVLLEPALSADDEDDDARRDALSDIDGAATRLLVVLPKRSGFPDPLRPRWVAQAELVPLATPQAVLDALELDGAVTRPDRKPGAWRGDLPAPDLEAPQLVRSSDLEPLLETDEGILVGRWRGGDDEGWTTIVVADPDLLATHGLGDGDNAAIAVGALEALGDGPVVIDETLHGHALQPSLSRELLRFPLALATLHAALAGALLAWIALVRFGRPRAPEPPLAAGKATLVEHTAQLLRAGGHLAHAAQAYLRAAKDEVVARLRPPGETTPADAWLHAHAAARGKARALRLAEERVSRLDPDHRGAEEEVVRAALAIHRWREEMTDGAAPDPRPDR